MKFNSLSLGVALLNLAQLSLGLHVTKNTTLTGDQTFNEDIIVDGGVTLTIKDGKTYVFNGDLDILGTLDIIGDATTGIAKIDFGTGHTYNNRGNVYIRNIAPSGDAAEYVISPTHFFNHGETYFSTLASTIVNNENDPNYHIRNFTLAPTSDFYNYGTIDFDSDLKVKEGHGFLYFGSNKTAAFHNYGTVKVAGTSNFTSEVVYAPNEAKGIEINGPASGAGKIYNKSAMTGINHKSVQGQQFLLNNGLLYAKSPKESQQISYNSYGGGKSYIGVVGSGAEEGNFKSTDKSTVSYQNNKGAVTHFVNNKCASSSTWSPLSISCSCDILGLFSCGCSLGIYLPVIGHGC